MFVDLWGWFWREEQRAYHEQDANVLRLVELARKGWMHRRNAQGDAMLATFREAAQIAAHIEHPCWELFCTYWACSTLFYHVDDLEAAMHDTVQLTARAHQSHFADCPIRGRIYFLLADIYYEIDVFGYEDKIRAALSYLTEHIAMDEDTYFRVQHRLADLAFLHERYDEAHEGVTAYMAEAQNNRFRLRSAHQLLQAIAYARGDLLAVHSHAQHVEIYARAIESHIDVGVALLWQATCAIRADASDLAEQHYQQALYLFETYELSRWLDYYNARCEYLELTGRPDEALTLRNTQIDEYADYGSIWYLGRAHLQRCRLLGRMGQDCETALHEATALIDHMRKPHKYITAIESIRAGDYHQYAWQRPALS